MHLPRIRRRIGAGVLGLLSALVLAGVAGVAYAVSGSGIPSYLRAQQLTLGFGSPNAVLTNCSGALCVNGSPPGKTILTSQCGPDNGATACTSRTSTTSFACDAATDITITAGKNYAVQAFIETSGSATGGGFKVSIGGVATVRDAQFVVNNNTSTALVAPLAQAFGNAGGNGLGEAYGCTGCSYVVKITAWISTASTGNFCIFTSQNSSSATSTTYGEMWLQLTQLN